MPIPRSAASWKSRQQPAASFNLPLEADPGRPGGPDRATRPITEGPGTRIGPYKLLQQIGEGGMGVVYMAEQEKPVRRGSRSRSSSRAWTASQVVARFEAERQALALMDHLNIARVLDAGATETGRPYFVMELVKGVPITDYCDENKLTPARTAGALHPGLPGDPARPSEGDHPPRHQAVQRAGDALRRQAGAQGDRLRRGQGDRAAADRADACSRSTARSSARWNT